MFTASRFDLPKSLCVAALTCSVVSCRGSDSPSRAPGASASPTPSALRTQPVDADPCGWLPRVEVERVLGPLSTEPVRVSDAEQFDRPDPQGTACLYRLAAPAGGLPALIS